MLDLHATIETYYFQIITDNLNVPLVRMIFLICYISVMLIHLFTYCFAAESLMTEVKQFYILRGYSSVGSWENPFSFAFFQSISYGIYVKVFAFCSSL